jgi:hypothetical protein
MKDLCAWFKSVFEQNIKVFLSLIMNCTMITNAGFSVFFMIAIRLYGISLGFVYC